MSTRLKIAAPAMLIALLATLAAPAHAADALAQVCDRVKPSVACIMNGDKPIGSGIVVKVKNDYYVFTLIQFAGKEGERTVVLPGDKSFTAAVYGLNAERGIAVLKIREPKDIGGADTGKFEDLAIGRKVIALGLPDGEEITATFGIVSTLHTEKDAAKLMADYIVTDALISTANYGGPLVNMKGEVVGICAPYRGGKHAASRLGRAIPVEYYVEIALGATAPEAVTPQDLGLSSIQDVSYSLQKKYDIDKGAWIGRVDKKGPAYEAGLRSGDVVIKVGGKPVDDADDFVRLIAKYKLGSTFSVKVVRKDGDKIVTKTLSIKTAKKAPDSGVSLDGDAADGTLTAARPVEPDEIAFIVRRALPDVASVGSGNRGTSGFVLMQKGKYSWLVTDGFAVKNKQKIKVRFPLAKPDKEGRKYIETWGEVIGVDEIRGVAVIRVERKYAPSPWSADTTRETATCSQVVIVGSTCEREGLTSCGVISARRNISTKALYPGFMLTDALVAGPNRGAPVLDASGALVGMAVSGGSAYTGMGTVLPLKDLKKIATELVENGRVERGYIGIKALYPLGAEDRKKLNINIPVGLRIGAVIKGGPAARANLAEGMIILKFNGQWVRSVAHLKMLVATAPVGKHVEIEIAVDGVRRTIRIAIDKAG